MAAMQLYATVQLNPAKRLPSNCLINGGVYGMF
jgi:hypothetical protein